MAKTTQTEQQKLEAIERLLESALEIAATINERLDKTTILAALSDVQEYLSDAMGGETA